MADTEVPPREAPIDGVDEDDADAAEDAGELVEETGEPSFEELLESTFYWDADAAIRTFTSATLGVPVGEPELDRLVDAAAAGTSKVAEAMEMRMQAARVLPATSSGGEAMDSVIASTFVRISQRAERLCRSRRAVQLEFLAHCMLGCAAAFTARGAVIERLFPDSLWRTVQLASKLLARIGTEAPAPKPRAAAAAAAAGKEGLRKRGGKGKEGDAAAADAADADAGSAVAEAEGEEAEAEAGLQRAVHGLRVTLVLFLHATQGPLPNVEKVLAADGAAAAKGAAAGGDKAGAGAGATTAATAAADLAALVSRARLVPRVKGLLDSAGAVAIIRAAYDAHARPGVKEGYAGGMGPLYAFFAAPLLVVACLTGVALLWAPQLLPEQVAALIPAEVSSSLSLRPHQEWVRYAGTALCAGAVVLLLAQMISYSGVAPLAPRLAVVHAGLCAHPDVAAIFQARAGSTPLPWEALGPAPHPADVGETPAPAAEAAAPAAAAADAAPASSKGKDGKGKESKASEGKGAGARPASPASRSGVTGGAGAGAGAAAAADASAGAAEETLTADELADATGLPVETVDDMVVCLQEVAALQEELAAQDAAREEALDAAFEEAANEVDDAERAAAAAAAAGSKAAAAPAPPPDGERKYSDAAVAAGNAAVEAARASLPPYTVTLDPKPAVLDSLEQALELLAIKLEEVGEADVADEVAARLRWLQDLRARLVAPAPVSAEADASADAEEETAPGAVAAAAATGASE